MNNQLMTRTDSGASLQAPGGRLPKWVTRGLESAQGKTVIRAADVHNEAIVAAEKVDELTFTAWKAMCNHAMLDGWSNQLAGDNPALADDLRFYKDMARLGSGEVIADLVDRFRRM
jgi:hypothetical protein